MVNEGVYTLGPQEPQVSRDPNDEGAMTNMEIRMILQTLTHDFMTQVTRDARVQVNRNMTTTASMVRASTRINPLVFMALKWMKVHKGVLMKCLRCLML